MTKKIALVTGGSRGLGKDMALSLAAKGNNVLLTYNSNKDKAEEVVKEIESAGGEAYALQLNVADTASFNNFFSDVKHVLKEKWNAERIDFLINNAGIGATVSIADMTEEKFDELVNIHFKGVYFITQKALEMMNDNGCVINISSGTTRFCVPGYSVYSSLKSCVETFSKYVAKEMGERGIRANTVAPGPIETDFNDAAIRTSPERKKFLSSLSPLGRVGNADDIGSVVAFLCSDDAKWINAQRIEVSGGINP